MPVKVSVIVPVYNPGHYIDDCVDSLLRQSLPDDEYEVIFVDDGSTDDTPARLDAVAAEHPHVHVIHQENSGWSGKPRNVGIDASKGEFVMFVDNDDYLGDEALERMYDYGVANDADVVVGKMAGKGRGVPVELFRRNHPRATVENAPLIDSLTPHKMVRRAFLDRTGLRFPEGRRRLEDHVFVTEAYLRADNVSVLSDYVCYYHVRRDDASNAGFQQFDPAGYFTNLREALDVVERYTEPGPKRDRLYRRWLRNEMVERLRGTRFLKAPEDFRKELFQQIHEVVVERFGPGVAAGLMPTQKFVARLAREGRYDDVAAFAEWEAGIKVKALPERFTWRSGVLEVVFAAEFVHGGKPMTFPADAVAPSAEPPESVQEAIDWLAEDTAARFDKGTLDLVFKERSNAAPHFQPVKVTRDAAPAGEDRVRLVLRATATVDPATAAGDGPLQAGLWDAVARLKLGGWTKEVRVGPAPKGDRSLPHGAAVLDGAAPQLLPGRRQGRQAPRADQARHRADHPHRRPAERPAAAVRALGHRGGAAAHLPRVGDPGRGARHAVPRRLRHRLPADGRPARRTAGRRHLARGSRHRAGRGSAPPLRAVPGTAGPVRARRDRARGRAGARAPGGPQGTQDARGRVRPGREVGETCGRWRSRVPGCSNPRCSPTSGAASTSGTAARSSARPPATT
jgi:glycosyltransferase involved in cell wall biosynthesis